MQRREFIAGLGGAVAWPAVAVAQPRNLPLIGFVYGGAVSPLDAAAFRKGLSETGYVEGQNVVVEYHWIEGKYDRLPALALELVRRQVAILMTTTTPATLAAKGATTTIPIVFDIGADPVKLGIVSSLNRPEGNITGVSVITNALSAKNLELLHQLVPRVALIAMLVNPANQNAQPDAIAAQAAATSLGLSLLVLEASDPSGLEAAFSTLVRQQAGALLVSSDLFFVSMRDQFATLSARHQVPAIYDRREFTDAGGLVSYGPNIPDSMRQAGVYVGRILRGQKPADLPVIQPTKYELVINLKTAKALGLTIPETLLATADEVIQ
jgi:putative ABC transport system substrate-binding protein